MSGITVDQARDILLEKVEQINETEVIPLWDSVGRVIARDIVAQHSQPPFPRSPLDGYALRSEDIKHAAKENPVSLIVIDEVTAGHISSQYVSKGMAVRIMTGAPIPDGADCVIRQEDTDYGEVTVAVYKSLKKWQNYCFEGEDYKKGEVILARDTMIGAVEAGILASLGYDSLEVYRQARVMLITTGDELVLPGEALEAGKIYDSNLYTLGTRLRQWGAQIISGTRLEDNPYVVAREIQKGVCRADIVITTGGVSVEKKDIMHDVISILGCEKLFWKIEIKPGMPTLCAVYQGKLLICLSGNPYGAAVNLELLVRPLLAFMMRRKDLELQRIQAKAVGCFGKKSGVARYVRGYYREGKAILTTGSNDSGIMSSMCGCNSLIEIPAGSERLNEGDDVWTVLL